MLKIERNGSTISLYSSTGTLMGNMKLVEAECMIGDAFRNDLSNAIKDVRKHEAEQKQIRIGVLEAELKLLKESK